jgi:pSer/pThr/pTyr-binding forkhead associated (FHA) protein
MGRGHESDLRINDISVSRLHAMIKYKNGKFLLEDNVSKFGTLVLINKRTPLSPGYNKAVQIGRSVINFSVRAVGQSSSSGAMQAIIEASKASEKGYNDNEDLEEDMINIKQ